VKFIFTGRGQPSSWEDDLNKVVLLLVAG